MGGAELYARNAAEMWASLAPWTRVVPGMPPGFAAVGIPAQSATRVIVRWPGAADSGPVGALLTAADENTRVVVEDSFGDLMLAAGRGVGVDRMPVMVRAAGEVRPPAPTAGVRLEPVTGPQALVQAERVIVDGFPHPALQPFRPGRKLPPQTLVTPGWRTWLAYRDGEPAAACSTYDDGTALGIYWLATLPGHRSLGLGRAVMSAALAASPDRPAALVATAAGEPLYASLGFQTVSEAAWYRKPHPRG